MKKRKSAGLLVFLKISLSSLAASGSLGTSIPPINPKTTQLIPKTIDQRVLDNEHGIKDQAAATLAETARAKGIESGLRHDVDQNLQSISHNKNTQDAINSTQFATNSNLQNKINDENTRATAAEKGLDSRITTNSGNISSNTTKIDEEKTRATKAENDLGVRVTTNSGNISGNTTKIDEEKTRATKAENDLGVRVTTNSGNISGNTTKIDEEKTRATKAENDLGVRVTSNKNEINMEISNRKNADTNLQNNIDKENTRAVTAEGALDSRVKLNEGSIQQYQSQLSKNTQTMATNTQQLSANTAQLTANKDAMDIFRKDFTETRDRALTTETLVKQIKPQIETNTQDILNINLSLPSKVDRSELNSLATKLELERTSNIAVQAHDLAKKNQADLDGFMNLGLTSVDIKKTQFAIERNTQDIAAIQGILGPNYANGQFAKDVEDLRTHSADIQANTATAAAATTKANIAFNLANIAKDKADANSKDIDILEVKQNNAERRLTQTEDSIVSLQAAAINQTGLNANQDMQISSLNTKTADLDSRLIKTENSVSAIETKLNDQNNGLASKSSIDQTTEGMSQITGEKVSIDLNGDIHTGIDDSDINGTHSNRKLSEDLAKLGSFTETTPTRGKSTTIFANNLATEGSLTVSGDTSLKNTEVHGTFVSDGNATFKSTVDINGETHANGGLTVGLEGNKINVGDRLNHLGKLNTANGSFDAARSTGAMKVLADTINRNAASVERITGIDISKFGSSISTNPDENDPSKILTNKALTERSAENRDSIDNHETRITTNRDSIVSEIIRARSAEVALGDRITTNKTNITKNTTDITDNKSLIDTNTAGIKTNAGEIIALKTATGGMTTNSGSGTTSTSNNFSIGGDLTVAGTTSLNKGAAVTGGLTTDTLVTTGNTSVGGNLTLANKAASSDQAVRADQLVQVSSDITGQTTTLDSNGKVITGIDDNGSNAWTNTKLTGKVQDHEKKITANRDSIAKEVKDRKAAITANKSLIDTNTAGINTNAGDISALQTATGGMTTNSGSGTTSTSNNFSIGGDLTVAGTTSLNKGAAVTGGLTTDTLVTTGNTSVGGNLTLANKATSSDQAVRVDQLVQVSSDITGQTTTLDKNGNIITGIDDNGSNAWTNTKLTGKVQDHEKKITANRDSIDDHETRITANRNSIDDHKKRITANRNSIDDHEKRITTNKASIDDHEKRITTNKASIDDHEKRITTNKASIDNHEKRITTNKASIDNHEKRITALQTATGGMTTHNGTTSTTNNFDVGGNLDVTGNTNLKGTLTSSEDIQGKDLIIGSRNTKAAGEDQLEKLAGVGIDKFSTISDIAGDQSSTVMTNRALTETVNKNIGTFDYTSNPRGGIGTMSSTGSSFGAVNRALADIDTLDTKQDTHLGQIDDTIKQFNADIKTNTQHIASLDTKVTGLTTDVKNLENIVGVSHSSTQSSSSTSPTPVVSGQLSQASGAIQLPQQQVSGATNGGVVSSSAAQNGLIPPALVNNQGYKTNPQGVVHSVQTNYQDTVTNSKFIGDTSKLHNNLKDGANTNTVTAINKVDDKTVKNTSDISTNKSQISENRKTIDHNSAVLANRSARNAAAIQDQNKAIRTNSAKIDQVQSESRKGLADAAAMGSIKYPKLDTGEGAVGAGYGNYKGQSSIAIGVGVQATDNVFVNTSAAATSGADSSVLVGAGVTYKFKLF